MPDFLGICGIFSGNGGAAGSPPSSPALFGVGVFPLPPFSPRPAPTAFVAWPRTLWELLACGVGAGGETPPWHAGRVAGSLIRPPSLPVTPAWAFGLWLGVTGGGVWGDGGVGARVLALLSVCVRGVWCVRVRVSCLRVAAVRWRVCCVCALCVWVCVGGVVRFVSLLACVAVSAFLRRRLIDFFKAGALLLSCFLL